MNTDITKCPCCAGPSKVVGPGFYGTIYCCQNKDCKGSFFTEVHWQEQYAKFHPAPKAKPRSKAYRKY